MSQPLPFSSIPPKPQKRFHRKHPRPEILLLPHSPEGLEQPFKEDSIGPICEALTGLLKE